jgi:hypothetical protein
MSPARRHPTERREKYLFETKCFQVLSPKIVEAHLQICCGCQQQGRLRRRKQQQQQHGSPGIDAFTRKIQIKDMMIDSFFADNPILIPYGCACLVAHIVLFVLFKYVLKPGPWKEVPSFTAHQVIALVLMIQWTVLGIQNLSAAGGHLRDESSTPNPLYDGYRVLRRFPAGMDMAQRSMGALWIWDIPVSLFSKDMAGFDVLMHAHHLGMLLITCIVLGLLSFGPSTAGGGWPIASCYAPVFLGVIELSSIPLQVVDLFHPKKAPEWCSYMKASPFLSAVNEVARSSFALLFLAVRGVYFPYMIVTTVLPECWTALRGLFPSIVCLPIGMILTFAVAFTALQLHWATLVVKQIIKTLGGDDGGNVEKGKSLATDDVKKDE